MADSAVRLRYSDDGGYNVTNWEEESIGQVGEYQTRVVFTRLGSTYQRCWEITCSSPRRRDLMGATIAITRTDA
jgi:hypothetical protein